MSLLIKGSLREDWFESEQEGGAFVRKDSQFRNWVTVDGAPGPSGEGGFKAEPGRYHLYISYACPWAHRTLIFRTLKKLEDVISVSVVHPYMGKQGWQFAEYPGATVDGPNGFDYLHQVYTLADPDYSGIVTVPVLWDKQRKTIVNNESADIIRMLNSAFDEWGEASVDLYPLALHDDINAINAFIYDAINNGVYKAGFATTQEVYAQAFDRLFNALNKVESRLSEQRYLVGGCITEADWRLFTTLVRFDPVYVGHFKCNLYRIADYPNLSNYLRDLYQQPGIAATVNMQHIKLHYYSSHEFLNPSGIVPKGPLLEYTAAHDRGRFDS
ncbi:glutathione S-transferase family protein [Sulfuriflexus sp.]|uniref:glutathione S-transferase family protein n=1 Tax=Sulfuriflexus sp. TaxID=2015443 RepID=UPI0028CEB7B0|nr:glutathione S-transferase family protein [Sulfuriflexus sp.]MDT8405258.1 glutathione S-transferase family protein [Sulfuriflexus sp.]